MVVFRQFNPADNEFTVYFSGLSGEIKRIQNPNFDPTQPDSDENPRLFTLRKTLAIWYKVPGDPRTRSQAAPVRVDRQWVMR